MNSDKDPENNIYPFVTKTVITKKILNWKTGWQSQAERSTGHRWVKAERCPGQCWVKLTVVLCKAELCILALFMTCTFHIWLLHLGRFSAVPNIGNQYLNFKKLLLFPLNFTYNTYNISNTKTNKKLFQFCWLSPDFPAQIGGSAHFLGTLIGQLFVVGKCCVHSSTLLQFY